MIVEATYVLCTSQMRTIDEKEARHREKVCYNHESLKYLS